MRINVEFEHEWTIEEIEAYLRSDCDIDRYLKEMDESSLIELAACAYIYKKYHENNEESPTEFVESNINENARNDICSGIRDLFFAGDPKGHGICEDYICYYDIQTFGLYDIRQIPESIITPKDGPFELALRLNKNYYFLIHDHDGGWEYYLLYYDYDVLQQGIYR